MKHIPSYSLVAEEGVSVTVARHFVANNQIKPPALILIKRSAWTVDRFFWSDKGMFGATYVERNYFNFAYLRELYLQLRKDEAIDFEDEDSLLAAKKETQKDRYEFAFI